MIRHRDHGGVLVLTLVLTVVLAVVVIALAGFVTVGLRTSDVTDRRTETNADGAAVVTWAMDAFRTGALDLSSCGAGTESPIVVPAALNVNGSATSLSCEVTAPDGLFPVVHLRATATDGTVQRQVESIAQFSPGVAVRALDWKVDDSELIIP